MTTICNEDPIAAFEELPEPNKMVLGFLVKFFQYLTQPEFVETTKMTKMNIATLIAPCIMHCPCVDIKKTVVFMEQERRFLLGLLEGLDAHSYPNFRLMDTDIDDFAVKKKKTRWPSIIKRHSTSLNLSSLRGDNSLFPPSPHSPTPSVSPPSYDESLTSSDKSKGKKKKKHHSSSANPSHSSHKGKPHQEINDDEAKKDVDKEKKDKEKKDKDKEKEKKEKGTGKE